MLVHLDDVGGFEVLDVVVCLDLLVELARAYRHDEALVAHL